MKKFRCTNIMNCDYADDKKILHEGEVDQVIEDSGMYTCAKCGQKLEKITDIDNNNKFLKPILIAVIALVVLAGLGFGISKFLSDDTPKSEDITHDSTVIDSSQITPVDSEVIDNSETPTNPSEENQDEQPEEEPIEVVNPTPVEPEIIVSPEEIGGVVQKLPTMLEQLRQLDEGQISSSERNDLYRDLLVIKNSSRQLGSYSQDEILADIVEIEMELRRLNLGRERNLTVRIIQQLR